MAEASKKTYSSVKWEISNRWEPQKAEKHFQDDPEPIIVDYTLEVYEICLQFLTFAVMRSKSLDIVRCFAPILTSLCDSSKRTRM